MLRIQAEVHSVEVNKGLLEKVNPAAPMKLESTDDYVVPIKRQYIKSMLYDHINVSPPMQPMDLVRLKTLLEPRQEEVRFITEFVIKEILQSISTEEEHTQYATSVHSLQQKGLIMNEDRSISGEPVIGVSIPELRAATPLHKALIESFLDMGYANAGSHRSVYEMSISKFFEALRTLGLSKKGNNMKKIEEVVVELYGAKGGGKLLNVSIVVDSLPTKIASLIRSKVINRNKTATATATATTTARDENLESAGDENALSSKRAIETNSVEMEGVEEKDGALELAIAIQRANQMNQDRTKVDGLREKEEEIKAELLLASPDDSFMSTAQEILRNTMFNLIQEALYDEFSIGAEPIKFLSSPEKALFDEQESGK